MVSYKDLVVCLFLLCFQIAQGKFTRLKKPNEFIVGGQSASKPIPYQVSYQFLDENDWIHFCGGAIISRHHVLTAAHCMTHSQTSVVVGTISVSDGGSRYYVDWQKKHPKFTTIDRHDIGVLRIEGSFVWSKNVQPIAFDSRQFFPDGETVWVSGWGYTDQHATVLPDTLQYLAQKTLYHKDCKREWGDIDYGHICADAGKRRGTCTADSGGPLVNYEKNMLVGIVSYGSNLCASGIPDVYTRVSSYVDWIENTIHKKCV